jgi:hypothetical protein
VREETRKMIGYKPDTFSKGGYMLSSRRVPDDEVYTTFRDEKGRYGHEVYRITETECGILHVITDYTKPWFKAIQRDRQRVKDEKADALRWKHIRENPRYPDYYDSSECELTRYGIEQRLEIRKVE